MHPYSIATWGTLLIFLIFLFTKNAETFIYTWYIMIFTIGGMIGLNGSSLNFTQRIEKEYALSWNIWNYTSRNFINIGFL